MQNKLKYKIKLIESKIYKQTMIYLSIILMYAPASSAAASSEILDFLYVIKVHSVEIKKTFSRFPAIREPTFILIVLVITRCSLSLDNCHY